MNFVEYSKTSVCIPFRVTEQSQTFLVNRNGQKRVCKVYPNSLERCREELAYRYVLSTQLLNVPEIFLVGDDFIEIQHIEEDSKPSLWQVVRGVATMYAGTKNNSHVNNYFPRIDTSREKIMHRLEYLPEELNKRRVNFGGILESSRRFTKDKYNPSPHQCLVHGDLKPANVIQNEGSVFYVDLALMSVSSPWYDLAFLYMGNRKKESFEELIGLSMQGIDKSFDFGVKEARSYLHSAVFYRTLFDLVFASRHRKDKTLIRVIDELNETLEGFS